MSPMLKECEKHAMRLPVNDRAALAKHLLSSLDDFDPNEHERLWVKEADARYDAYKRGELAARPMDEVLRDARAALR